MLKIKIELIPLGIHSVASTWNADIWNNATGTRSVGNYFFRIYQKNSETKIWRGGEIKGFLRLTDNVWYLLYLCLKTIYGESND